MVFFITNQQSVGGVNGDATGKGVMDREPIHISGLPVTSPLVNIPAHVEMDGIAAFLTLLAHVLQLHVWQMDWGEVSKDLYKGKARTEWEICH